MAKIECSICKKTFNDIIEEQEFIFIDEVCGYGSVFGDGSRKRINICQYCQENILGKYMEIDSPIIEGEEND